MIIDKCINDTPWYDKQKYLQHIDLISVLYQDESDKRIHEIAISNHDKIDLLFRKRMSRRKHNFIISDGFRSYMYCYKLNRKNKPLLCQKITL